MSFDERKPLLEKFSIEENALGNGYYFINFNGFEEAEISESTLDELLKHIVSYAEDREKPLKAMLDKLGVEKCPVCAEHLIDDDMNVCEKCNYGVHEWCTGYTYEGDGEYPDESAYAICKNCYKPQPNVSK